MLSTLYEKNIKTTKRAAAFIFNEKITKKPGVPGQGLRHRFKRASLQREWFQWTE